MYSRLGNGVASDIPQLHHDPPPRLLAITVLTDLPMVNLTLAIGHQTQSVWVACTDSRLNAGNSHLQRTTLLILIYVLRDSLYDYMMEGEGLYYIGTKSGWYLCD